MKRISSLSAIIALCCGIGAMTGCSGKPSDGEHKIIVCATTDIHGAYFDCDYDGNQNATSLSKVSSYIRQLRKDGAKPVLIDCGDALQGDLAAYYYNYINTQDEHVFMSMADYIGYDALVVGNHDIETGHDVYDRMLKHFPKNYLAANAIDNDGENRGKCYFTQYSVVKRDGLKIAIIGMTNGNIKSWLPEEKYAGMEFFIISNVAQMVVDGVRNAVKPDIVILAVHSGAGHGFPGIENEAEYLAADVKGVDMVICGHDHKATLRTVPGLEKDVPLMDAGTKAQFLAQAEFTVNVKKRKVVGKKATTRIIPMEDVYSDEAFNKAFSKQYEEVKAYADRVIGTLDGDIEFSNALDGPSEYINLVQTVQLKASGADVSFAAPLTVKGKIAKGDIKFKNLSDLYRFENQLYVVKMTGKQIKDYLEYSYEMWISATNAPFNYDSADGIRYEVDRKAAKGSRINIMSMCDGSAFDPDKTYKVAMTSYRASGGGNLLNNGAGITQSDLEIVGKYDDIRSLIGDWISEQGTVTPSVATNWKWAD